MVLSKLSENVSYVEEKEISENDKGRNVSLFKISLYEVPIVIALGDVKYDFVKENILFCPVYIIVDESDKIYQIGVYEFFRDDYDNVQDSDGDINISILDGPLLYSFVTESYIKKCMQNEFLIQDNDRGDEEDDIEDEEDDIEEPVDSDDEDSKDEKTSTKSNIDAVGSSSSLLEELGIHGYEDDDDFLQKGESEREDKKIRKKYKKKPKNEASWIQSFMNNNNYTIQDNAGSGDCLFYTIVDAFASISITTSVDELREQLSTKVNDSLLTDYKQHYDMYKTELKKLMKNEKDNKKLRKKLAAQFKDFKTKAKKEKDVPTRKTILKQAKQVKEKYDTEKEKSNKIMEEIRNAKEMLSEFAWMKNINSVDSLKDKVKSCDFWADSWAINTMEELINTKIIVLSSDNYHNGLYNKVLSCGDMVSNAIEEKGYFKPKYYIIVEHTGNHYKLIGYKDVQIFRFHQIPWGVKDLIKKQCLSSSGKNIFHYIPKFAKEIGVTIIPEESKLSESKETPQESKIDSKNPQLEDNYREEEMSQTPTPEDSSLFDENVVFMFHSGSAHKPPGKGTGEKITKEKLIEYSDLAKIKHWRRTLSNFHMKKGEGDRVLPLFSLDGKNWASVEHYYHANKFKKNNPDYYNLFSIDSGSQIMDDPKKALGAGGKTGKIKGKKFRPNDVVMDEDFFENGNNEKVMEKAQMAKYSQDEDSRRVLLATKDAKLVHYIKSRKPADQRPPPVVFYDTMRIRHKLQKKI